LECGDPKSELTLTDEEFKNLLHFLQENYEPFKDGVTKYIPLDSANFDQESMEHIKGLFSDPDQEKVLDFIAKNKLFSDELILSIEHQKRIEAIKEFEEMLANDLLEHDWQKWLQKNSWVLGTEFVRVLDERNIDTDNIADYLMQAYDGFLDIIEIKRPEGQLTFWSQAQDHGNWIPSSDLIKAVTQATGYILEVERESNSLKFLEKVDNVKTIKPRCTLIFGRSNDWTNEQKEAYRILNSSYHSLTIMTYDHVLDRAKRIVGITDDAVNAETDEIISDQDSDVENIAEVPPVDYESEVRPEDLPF
ncbi:MAG: DUF4263 domain-containing protein, partial [Nanoarchaeota archaeon]|nr:DUF4263 domain-containing protein [Nanoarchaeota archaeon]